METIVVGTDFSLPAQNAVNYAATLARHLMAKLVLVNAYPLPLAGYDSIAPLDLMAALQESSKKALDELKQDIVGIYDGIDIVCLSQVGTPYAVLKDAVSEYKADFVVTGMVGEGSFLKRHLMGSNAISVARDFDIPVFIIPEGSVYGRIRNICFACDADKIVESGLLSAARELAEKFGATLELVSVESPGSESMQDTPNAPAVVDKELHGIKYRHVHISDGNVSTALEFYFKIHNTDLVMVNPRKHNLLQKLFTVSITKSLAYTLTTPLLAIH